MSRTLQLLNIGATVLAAAYLVFLLIEIVLVLDGQNAGAWRTVPVLGQILGVFGDPAPRRIDVMLHSSAITFFLAMWLMLGARDRMEIAIDSMKRLGAMSGAPDQVDDLRKKRAELSARLARNGAIGVAIAELAVITVGTSIIPVLFCGQTLATTLDPEFFALLAVGFLAGAMAGYFLGLMSGFGAFYEIANTAGCRILPNFDNADGYVGFGYLTTFMSRQGWLSLLPVIWIASWLVLLGFRSFAEDYDIWRIPFALLFILAVVYGWNGFYRPRRDLARVVQAAEERARSEGNNVALTGLARVRRRMFPPPSFYVALIALFIVAIAVAPFATGLASWDSSFEFWACGI